MILLPVVAVANLLTSYFSIQAGLSARNFMHAMGICMQFHCSHCQFSVPDFPTLLGSCGNMFAILLWPLPILCP
jgi:hypothetical protein